MKFLTCSLSIVLFSLGCATLPAPAMADASHARIVRLSLVQGDVRFSRQFHKDSLDDSKAVWEPAPLNLPIREGFALSTGADARAEVEFENGAMAFLSANTVIEFYDLTLDEGALVTRLILRQGSAIFYVHPANGDFFSVTGGDFSVEANGRSRFRLDNYDDGSTVSVEQGQVAVLRKDQTKTLQKGDSYSIDINEAQSPVLARSSEYDDFDKWVSGRIDSVATATEYSSEYVSSPAYSSGFADLYSYGSWYGVPGYGYGWQPFGVGLGWSPFGFGNWNYDPLLGWNFIGSAPWGWLPYHYGGWIFNPGRGWLWVPTGFGPVGPVIYRPVTAVWMRAGGVTGLVPLNPADSHGKPPLNLNQGIYAVRGNSVEGTAVAAGDEKWSVVNHPQRELFTAPAAAPTAAPIRVSRTILAGDSGSRAVTLSRDSSIVYDPGQHRFVNSSDPTKTPVEPEKTNTQVNASEPRKDAVKSGTVAGSSAKPAGTGVRTAAARPNITPPNPPASTRGSHASGGAIWDRSAMPDGTSHTSSAATSTGHSGGGHH
jgi:FecR protein